ncbi:hypothetical protein [Mesorhizobium sp. M0019]|uniref:hypothetical protein n=1 Tax=Mesorhizobium sp. M0019 TaxID=2956845 RepID=UPI00333566A2
MAIAWHSCPAVDRCHPDIARHGQIQRFATRYRVETAKAVLVTLGISRLADLPHTAISGGERQMC